MNRRSLAEDPEPSEPVPAGLLLVPVRPGPLGHAARLFRTPLGDRTAVAFTTEQLLITVLGPAQPWVTLAEPALRALTEPLGVTVLTVDPQLAAVAARPRREGTLERPLLITPSFAGAPGRGPAPDVLPHRARR
ncbi:SAV_915 family protein [Kitasatospora sp. NPDC002965]|uniref:SAV_915 family protein n=1 Tax=Kitasatospora sp. NPDC002965 TaxID=3154775 RepID=UPI00339FADC0